MKSYKEVYEEIATDTKRCKKHQWQHTGLADKYFHQGHNKYMGLKREMKCQRCGKVKWINAGSDNDVRQKQYDDGTTVE